MSVELPKIVTNIKGKNELSGKLLEEGDYSKDVFKLYGLSKLFLLDRET